MKCEGPNGSKGASTNMQYNISDEQHLHKVKSLLYMYYRCAFKCITMTTLADSNSGCHGKYLNYYNIQSLLLIVSVLMFTNLSHQSKGGMLLFVLATVRLQY